MKVSDFLEDSKYERELEKKAHPLQQGHSIFEMPIINFEAYEKLEEYRSASPRERKLIREKEKNQVEILELKKDIDDVKRKQKNTVVYSIKNGTVFMWPEKDVRNKISFSRNRYAYISRIIKNEQTSLKVLTGLGSSAQKTNVSGAIKEINRRFRKIIPSHDLILNLGDGGGYFKNPELNLLNEK